MGADYTVGGLFVNWPILRQRLDATNLRLLISWHCCHCAARKIFLDRRRMERGASEWMAAHALGLVFIHAFVPGICACLGDMH
ncbi:hypothetical protein [Mesorhizobium loti]|uniref:hypothetical protein n=1 Tax=Rhizobium loti TaxID=381 RepID=UPI0004172A33|nr:hypothetical protein [Mesorhizobium loti]